MKKAPAPTFARAKADALRAIANVEWDAPVLDAIMFFDDGGFIIRMRHGECTLQRCVTWLELERAQAQIIQEVVRTMLETLARADFDA